MTLSRTRKLAWKISGRTADFVRAMQGCRTLDLSDSESAMVQEVIDEAIALDAKIRKRMDGVISRAKIANPPRTRVDINLPLEELAVGQFFDLRLSDDPRHATNSGWPNIPIMTSFVMSRLAYLNKAGRSINVSIRKVAPDTIRVFRISKQTASQQPENASYVERNFLELDSNYRSKMHQAKLKYSELPGAIHEATQEGPADDSF